MHSSGKAQLAVAQTQTVQGFLPVSRYKITNHPSEWKQNIEGAKFICSFYEFINCTNLELALSYLFIFGDLDATGRAWSYSPSLIALGMRQQ